MRITLVCIGRLKAGPERQLAAHYFSRLDGLARQVGITGVTVHERPESRADSADLRRRDEAARLIALVPQDAVLIALDETGRQRSSPDFADWLSRLRDAGTRDLCLAIGGPDGQGDELRNAAREIVSLGMLTFPHALARIILAEQLYRAATLLAGHPYHRN